MKYLIILILLTIGCDRAPTQIEIDRAASHQLSLKMDCALLSSELEGKGSLHNTNDGWCCDVFINKNEPPKAFFENELLAVTRFILLQKMIQIKK